MLGLKLNHISKPIWGVQSQSRPKTVICQPFEAHEFHHQWEIRGDRTSSLSCYVSERCVYILSGKPLINILMLRQDTVGAVIMWVSFMDPASDCYSASVPVIIYVMSYNIGPPYHCAHPQAQWWPILLLVCLLTTLQWHHNERDGISNCRCLDC